MDRPYSPSHHPPNAPANPFAFLKTRYLILGTFVLASLFIGAAYGLLSVARLLPWALNDPLSNPIFTLAVLTAVAGAIVGVGRLEGLKLKQLFGDR